MGPSDKIRPNDSSRSIRVEQQRTPRFHPYTRPETPPHPDLPGPRIEDPYSFESLVQALKRNHIDVKERAPKENSQDVIISIEYKPPEGSSEKPSQTSSDNWKKRLLRTIISSGMLYLTGTSLFGQNNAATRSDLSSRNGPDLPWLPDSQSNPQVGMPPLDFRAPSRTPDVR